MIGHQIYAQIFEEEIKHIAKCDNYELANYISRATYGDEAFAVDCLQYACGIGDKYHDNTFFHIIENGIEVPIEYIPTQEQEVDLLKQETENMAEYQIDLDYRVSYQELGL